MYKKEVQPLHKFMPVTFPAVRKSKEINFIKKMPEIQPLVVILPFDGIPSYKHRYEMQSSSAS